MDLNDLKNAAQNLQNKAQDLMNDPKVKDAVEKGKEKLEDFVEEKTDGKGILGFGKKN